MAINREEIKKIVKNTCSHSFRKIYNLGLDIGGTNGVFSSSDNDPHIVKDALEYFNYLVDKSSDKQMENFIYKYSNLKEGMKGIENDYRNICIIDRSSEIKGVKEVRITCREDLRGDICTNLSRETYKEIGDFPEIKTSRSKRNVIRGMHFDNITSKLVNVLDGKVVEIIVDVRKNSPTYLNKIIVELSDENKKQMLIPKGVAHGYLVVSDNAVYQYYLSIPDQGVHEQFTIAYDDPDLNIDWTGFQIKYGCYSLFDTSKLTATILSERDKNGMSLKEFEKLNDVPKSIGENIIENEITKELQVPAYEKAKKNIWILSIDNIDAYILNHFDRPSINFEEHGVPGTDGIIKYFIKNKKWYNIQIKCCCMISGSGAEKLRNLINSREKTNDVKIKFTDPVGGILETWGFVNLKIKNWSYSNPDTTFEIECEFEYAYIDYINN